MQIKLSANICLFRMTTPRVLVLFRRSIYFGIRSDKHRSFEFFSFPLPHHRDKILVEHHGNVEFRLKLSAVPRYQCSCLGLHVIEQLTLLYHCSLTLCSLVFSCELMLRKYFSHPLPGKEHTNATIHQLPRPGHDRCQS